jgi:hypothetical protein
MKNQEETEAEKIDEKLATVCSSMEETRKLMAEGKLSDQEFAERLEENKDQLDQTIHESSTLVETRKIIKRRATLLYKSVAKPRSRKKKPSKKGKVSSESQEKKQKQTKSKNQKSI